MANLRQKLIIKRKTMPKITKICLAIIGLSLMMPVFAAKDPNLKPIAARQGEMQLRSFNAGPLFGMAKGKIEYDAELASTLANNLLTLTKLNNGRAWKKGTDNKAYPDDTTALPKIWSAGSEIGKKGKAFKKAVEALAMVAGNGLDALKPKVSALGKSCKGCHDDYRKKKK